MKHDIQILPREQDGRLVAHGPVGITAMVVEHSDAYYGDPSSRKSLVTLQLRYPRFIHQEVLTHRDRGRNASSSRAIPVKKMIATTVEDPAFFVHVGANRPGMQAKEEVDASTRAKFELEWRELMHVVASYVSRWGSPVEEGGYGIHKQVANRALEPWQFINVVMTATEWDNFFELRDHEDAQPEFEALAQTIRAALDASAPHFRSHNTYPCRGDMLADPVDGWHLPYVNALERATLRLPLLLAISAARCARVSYLTHDGKVPSIEKDVELFFNLVGSRPLHASPLEHQGFALSRPAEMSGCFRGFGQFRHVYHERMPAFLDLKNAFLQSEAA